MYGSQFLIHANGSVSRCLRTAFAFMLTALTGFAFIEFFCSPILIPINRPLAFEAESSSVWAEQISEFISLKVYSTIWIFMILLIVCLFFEHGEFHIFFHPMLFAIKIIIVRTIPCIRNRIFGIMPICFIKLLHQWNKAFHV